MKSLEVDFDELAIAFEDYSGLTTFYLDTDSGEVVRVPESETEAQDLGFDTEEYLEEDHYVLIEPIPPDEGRHDRARFLETVTDPELRNLLSRAVKGRSADRRFKEALHNFSAERERWFKFKQALMDQRIEDWFRNELKLEPVKRKRGL